jgi:hypothetical protein
MFNNNCQINFNSNVFFNYVSYSLYDYWGVENAGHFFQNEFTLDINLLKLCKKYQNYEHVEMIRRIRGSLLTRNFYEDIIYL